MPSASQPPTHFQILSLPRTSTLQPETVKRAYHAALLKYHPDRTRRLTDGQQVARKDLFSAASTERAEDAGPGGGAELGFADNPTIDEITTAYKVLGDDAKRVQYERVLRLQDAALLNGIGAGRYHTGIETFDLEDLEYGEEQGVGSWSRSCRCGDGRGYVVTERDLEEEGERQEQDPGSGGALREILVPCRGCSLIIRVVFGVDDGG